MALTSDRDTPTRTGELRGLPVAAGAVIFAGGMVAISAGGVARVPTDATDVVLGRAEHRADNSAGADGDETIEARSGVFRFSNSSASDAIALSDIGSDCFAVDDEQVAKTDGGGSRPRAGIVHDVDASGVWVLFG